MSWSDEAVNSLRGCGRLFLRDTGGFDDFDLSLNGFWRSFAVILPIAPLYLYSTKVLTSIPEPGEANPEPAALDMAALALVVQWIAWPVVMIFAARLLGLAANYARYIVVYNWSSIIVMALQTIPVLLIAASPSLLEIATLLNVVILGVVLYYRWYIAQVALETTGMIAWTLVLADFVLSIGVTKLIA